MKSCFVPDFMAFEVCLHDFYPLREFLVAGVAVPGKNTVAAGREPCRNSTPSQLF